VCAVLTLAAVPRAHADLRADLQIWAWNIAAASLNMLTPGFSQAQPECHIHVNMTGANMQSRFLLSLSAGVGAPDLMQLQVREVPRYAVTGKLADLTELAAKYADAFAPSFWKDCVHNGRIYAIPWDMGPCAVFYKRAIFEKYHIDPATIETWADYIEAGKRLLKESGGQTKLMCLPTGITNDLFEILIQQNNCQVFDEEGRIAINSPEGTEVIDLFRDLIRSGVGANIEFFSHPFFASFRSDTIASYPMAVWFGGLILDYAPETSGKWGVFRLPAFRPGGLRTSNLGGSTLVIPEQCQHKEAAWAFIEYALCTHASQVEQYRKFELFPALVTTHGDPFFDEDVPFFGGQKVRRLFSLDIDRLPHVERTPDWMEAIRYLTQALSHWANGDLAPSDVFLADVEERLSRRLGRPISPLSPTQRKGR